MMWALGAVVWACLGSCTYQFSRLAVSERAVGRRLAVDTVVSESEQLGHGEILWTSLQQAILRDGNFLLSAPSEAELVAIVRLLEVKREPTKLLDHSGDAKSNWDTSWDPDRLPPLAALRSLWQTPRYATHRRWTYLLEVDLRNSRGGESLFRRRYQLSDESSMHTHALGGTGAIRAWSAEESALSKRAQLWAYDVTRDFARVLR